jgi:hypothetical protein
VIFLLYSCGTGMKIKKNNFKQINSHFSGTFNLYSNSYNTKYHSNQKIKLLSLFNIDTLNNSKVEKVTIKFDKENDLIISYENFWGTETKFFNGKFKKKGYYEVFLRKERIIIPLFYTVINVDRLRIGLAKNGDLIIDSYGNHSAMIFLMAGGRKGRTQFYFKKID